MEDVSTCVPSLMPLALVMKVTNLTQMECHVIKVSVLRIDNQPGTIETQFQKVYY